MIRSLAVTLAGLPLLAQAPLLQDGARALQEARTAWTLGEPAPEPLRLPSLEVGIGGAGSEGVHTPLVGAEGFGSGLRGWGMALQGRAYWSRWTFSLAATALREDGITRGTLQRAELSYRSPKGWRFALEQTPLQWGFGPLGGYLLGGNARPFPRLSVATRGFDVHLGHIPLGRWSAEFFYGRLEWNRDIPVWESNRLTLLAARSDHGDIRRPDLSGARFTGRFGPHVELNLAGTSMWGGVDPQGRRRQSGYTWEDYALGFFGAENIGRSETSGSPFQFDLSGFKQISMGHALAEVRVRIPPLARLLGARGASVYLSRGSKNVNWQWRDFLRHPFAAIGRDLGKDWELVKRGKLTGGDYMDSLWGRGIREAVPTLEHANDMIGGQLVFEGWEVSLDYTDLVNLPADGMGYRVYSHGTYLAGHSRYGDSLGLPFGGDVITRTVDLAADLPGEGRGRLKVVRGTRPFRDNLSLWSAEHPGQIPQISRFWFLQAEAQWRTLLGRVGATVATQREERPDHDPSRPGRWGWSFAVFQAFRVF